jgi:hypothetical protein
MLSTFSISVAAVTGAATKLNIEIRGFLQMGNTTAKTVTALDKLLSPTLLHLNQGIWEQCDTLSEIQEYAHCLHTNSSWLPIQSTGVYRESNKAKCAKRHQMASSILLALATAPVISSNLLSVVFFNLKTNVVLLCKDSQN